MKLAAAHVLVTGGSRGIGHATAQALQGRGARLTLVARNAERLERVAGELSAAAVVADLADAEQLATVIARAQQANGPVDVLINNAGLMVPGPLAHIGAAELRGVLSTNVLAPLELARAVLPSMLARRAGAIVNVTSLAGDFSLRNIIPYGTSKSALTTATHSLRRELKGTGVRAQLVVLGYVETDMMEVSQSDPISSAQANRLGKLPALTTESVAAAITRGIEHERRVMVLPPLAAPVHHLRQLPQRIVDAVMVGIPRSL